MLSFNTPPHVWCLLTFLMLEFLARPAIVWPQNHKTETLPHLTVSLDQNSARVGSVVDLTLSYRLPEGASLAANPEIKGLENLTILERNVSHDRITIKLLVDRLDSWQTGPLALPYLDKEGKAHILAADPISLKVLSNLAENSTQTELRPIQEIIPTTSLWRQYLPWAPVLLVILLLGMAVFIWHKRRRRHKDFRQLRQPPHVLATKALKQLEDSGLFEGGQIKEFYFRFSEIIRQYLERLKGFPAAEFTTEEIAQHLATARDRQILPLLRQADLIKFADAIPTPAKKDEDLKAAFLFIEQSRPTPENVNSSNEIRSPALKRARLWLLRGDSKPSRLDNNDRRSQTKVSRSVDQKNQHYAAGPKNTRGDA